MQKDLKFWKNLIMENRWLSVGVLLVCVLLVVVVWTLIFGERTLHSAERYDATMDVSNGELTDTNVSTTRAMTDEEWGAVENEEDGL